MRLPLLAAATLGAALACDWPQFRGPGSSGIAPPDAAPPVEFGPSKHLLWKTALPVGHSSPVVWGDRVFVNSFDSSTKKLELIAISGKTGAILWLRAATAPSIEETHVVSNPATATPLVDADRVYAYFSSYGLMAFDHAGEPRWTLPIAMPKTHHGSGASPVLAGELIIINHDAMQGGYLLAVDRRTGKEAWREPYVTGRVESYSSPLVWRDHLIVHRSGGGSCSRRRTTRACSTPRPPRTSETCRAATARSRRSGSAPTGSGSRRGTPAASRGSGRPIRSRRRASSLRASSRSRK